MQTQTTTLPNGPVRAPQVLLIIPCGENSLYAMSEMSMERSETEFSIYDL